MSKMICTFGTVILILFSASTLSAAEIPANPVFKRDHRLTIKDVFQQSVKRFPLLQQHAALQYEATALSARWNSFIAGAPSLSMRYQNDDANNNIGLEEYEAGLQLPLWRWEQRSAGKKLGLVASEKAASYLAQLQHQVAGQLRSAIWTLRLKQNRLLFAHKNYEVSAKLAMAVRRRVELGDLAKANLLLAESDLMGKQAVVEEAVAEIEVAKKRYQTLTGYTLLPENIDEPLSPISEINSNHPLLASRAAQIKQLEAQLDWVRAKGAGQPTLMLGVRSERSDRQSDAVDSLGATITVPFGGRVHREPKIAATNSQLTQIRGQYGLLLRRLNQDLYAITQQIAKDRRTLKLALDRSEIAQQHLKMSKLGFETGEITLIDLLKIQETAQKVALQAARQKIILQHDIARYNQTAGALL